MISAKEARDLVAARQDVAEELEGLNSKISEAANSGLFSIESAVEDEILGVQLAQILTHFGYDTRYESERSVLKIKW